MPQFPKISKKITPTKVQGDNIIKILFLVV